MWASESRTRMWDAPESATAISSVVLLGNAAGGSAKFAWYVCCENMSAELAVTGPETVTVADVLSATGPLTVTVPAELAVIGPDTVTAWGAVGYGWRMQC